MLHDDLTFQDYRIAHADPAAIGSSGWFSHERRFVEWAEAAGYRFDTCISTDLDDDPSIAEGYDLIIDVGHDEYIEVFGVVVDRGHVDLEPTGERQPWRGQTTHASLLR